MERGRLILLGDLKHVPLEAKITDYSDGDSETGESPYLEFELEQETE